MATFCVDCGDRINWGAKRCRSCYNKLRFTGRYYKDIRVNGKTVREHRHVMEIMLGRKLLPTEHVHHINGDIRDNRPENLQLMTHGEHSTKTHAGRRNTESTKKKMSDSAKRARASNPEPRYSRTPEETRQKQSEARKRYWTTKNH